MARQNPLAGGEEAGERVMITKPVKICGYFTSGSAPPGCRHLHIEYTQYCEQIERQLIDGREALAKMMLSMGMSTGHGDTIEDLIEELKPQIEEKDRENRTLRQRGSTCDLCNFLERDECLRQKDEKDAEIKELQQHNRELIRISASIKDLWEERKGKYYQKLAEVERLTVIIKRLGSIEAFVMAGSLNPNKLGDRELLARIDFARDSLRPQDAESKTEEPAASEDAQASGDAVGRWNRKP